MEKKQYAKPTTVVYMIRRPRLLSGSTDEIHGVSGYSLRYGGIDTEGSLDPD